MSIRKLNDIVIDRLHVVAEAQRTESVEDSNRVPWRQKVVVPGLKIGGIGIDQARSIKVQKCIGTDKSKCSAKTRLIIDFAHRRIVETWRARRDDGLVGRKYRL